MKPDPVQSAALNAHARPIHPSLIGVVAFWEWFGKSCAVDAYGRPLVLFHGSRHNSDIFEFSLRKSEMDPGQRGIYFTTSAEHASQYATDWGDSGPEYGGAIYPVYLRAYNPYVISAFDWDRGTGMEPEAALHEGFDSFIIRDQVDGDTFIVFDPLQIKSAVGNDGTFCPAESSLVGSSHPSIRRLLIATHLQSEAGSCQKLSRNTFS